MKQISFEAQNNYILILGLIMIFSTFIGITGCSQGGGGPAILKPEGTYKTGFFVDSPVEGLQYRCITWTGTTDSNGTFLYNEGEEMTFFIGGVVIGRSMANGIITPVDLYNYSPPNFSTEAINVSRFLLSLDEDLNPNNGILIPQGVTDALKDITVDFSNPDLDNDAGVQEMFEILNGSGIYPEEETLGLVSYESAQIHLENTVNKIAQAEAEAEEALSNLVLNGSIDLPYSSIIMIKDQSLNLKGSAYGGKTPYTYTWNINNENPFSTKQDPGNYTFKTLGSYILNFTVTDSASSLSSDLRHINVFDPSTQDGPAQGDSIPTVSIISPSAGITMNAGSTIEFNAIISNGDTPLYYGWTLGGASGNSYYPQNEDVVYISPRTYMITQGITLNTTGTYYVSCVVRDTGLDGKTWDDHAAGVSVIVK